MNDWKSLLVFVCVLVSIAVIYINYRRTNRMINTIEKMIDAAIEGEYSETDFDESHLSALETKFANYVSSSSASAQNVVVEKEKIKTLIADISHQTKTPIANLQLYSELLAEEDLTEEMRLNVDAIRHQTEKLCFLIDALVKLSRLENGILTLSPRIEEVGPMLNEIREQYASKANEKGLDFQVLDTKARAVFDRKWTVEAIGNIVDNAIKYTQTGRIVIEASEFEIFTRIRITDTGIGIEEAEQPKVFSRFYRSEDVRESEGVGIGLYLSRKIISDEGGYIKLSSKPGSGSAFSVFLPR